MRKYLDQPNVKSRRKTLTRIQLQIMPQSIVRFIQLSSNKNPPPFAASAFAALMFSLSGFLNVILYICTRPSLLPWSSRSPPEEIHEEAP
jgi:hypothetical protein